MAYRTTPAEKEPPIDKDYDLVGWVPPRQDTISDPSNYLKPEDFNPYPATTNDMYYPSKDQPVHIGGSPSKFFGGDIPIFSGSGALPPYALIDARQRALTQAQLSKQMYAEHLAKQNAGQAKGATPYYNAPGDVDARYNDMFQDFAQKGVANVLSSTKAQIGTRYKNGAEWAHDAQDFYNGYAGKQIAEINKKTSVMSNNIQQVTKQIPEYDKAVLAGEYRPPEYDTLMNEIKSGKYDFQNKTSQEMALDFGKMRAYGNVTKQQEEFNKSLVSSEYPTTDGKYITKENLKNAAGVALVKVNNLSDDEKRGWVKTFAGTPLDESGKNKLRSDNPTNEEIAQAMAYRAMEAHGTQVKLQPEGERKHDYNVSGNRIANNENAWTYYIDPEGTEHWTNNKTDKNALENKPRIFYQRPNGQSPITAIQTGYVRKKGDSYPTMIASKINPDTGKPIEGKEGELPLPYFPENVDQVKGEYGFNPLQARDLILGRVTMADMNKNSGVARSSNTPVTSTIQKSGSSSSGTNTAAKSKTISGSTLSSLVGTAGYEGYTEADIKKYYTDNGYTIK